MKMIKAVIRPEYEPDVIGGLEKEGFYSLTKWDVLGRGRQKGVQVGTAHYDEVAVLIVQDLGYDPAGFADNGDAGASYTQTQVVTSLQSAQAGDIVIMHINRPKGFTFEGLRQVLPEWRTRGYRLVRLREG